MGTHFMFRGLLRARRTDKDKTGFPPTPKAPLVLKRNTRGDDGLTILSSSRMRGPIQWCKDGFPSPTETLGESAPRMGKKGSGEWRGEEQLCNYWCLPQTLFYIFPRAGRFLIF